MGDSFYGDTIGLDLMGDADLEFGADSDITMSYLTSGSLLTMEQFAELDASGKTPYPNNFDLCTVQYDDDATVSGDVPDDKAVTDCLFNGVFGVTQSPLNQESVTQGEAEYGAMSIVDGLQKDLGSPSVDGGDPDLWTFALSTKQLVILALSVVTVLYVMVEVSCCLARRGMGGGGMRGKYKVVHVGSDAEL